ncbi:ROK family transcriptional regulator [Streptomyces albofaciens JCM 4342]|uniref:ROK family transcriptional regulator n=1 Tax=Streptomyces albofaciens TaxID=66866 RepID=UPI001239C52E|nr:ROK family transcriptional regulator [Streptomyces albofaciens]KAA6223090.1 ROK family transcriptional regulator [Streptomyces albofaciens JCM 4342]
MDETRGTAPGRPAAPAAVRATAPVTEPATAPDTGPATAPDTEPVTAPAAVRAAASGPASASVRATASGPAPASVRATAPAPARATPRTASPSTARAINDRLALQLLHTEGPLTAGELKAGTGLSRPTVADLVERLQAAGLIAVVGESGARRRGPNARLYGIVADRAHLAAVDLRTDSATVAVADLLGRVQAETAVPAGPDTDPEQAAANGVAALEKLLAAAGAAAPHAVAVGAPGLVDPATGRFRGTAWVPAWHAALVTALGALSAAPVLLENEVNLAAIAEQRDGAARDRDTFVLLWLGHGTGAAVVLDGRLRRGASGGTGEIGFLPVPGTGGLPTAAGCDGGFHSLAGSAAVCELAAEHGIEAGRGAEQPEPADPGAPPAEALVRAAVRAGGAGAAFLDALAARIALGAAAVCAVLDPGCVVLGGETGRAGGDALAERVADHLARMSPLHTEVRAGTVGGRAVLRGAVLAAMDAAQGDLWGPAA